MGPHPLCTAISAHRLVCANSVPYSIAILCLMLAEMFRLQLHVDGSAFARGFNTVQERVFL